MDFSAIGSNFSDSYNQREEIHFSRLFQVILDTIINLKQIPTENIQLAIEPVKRSFNRFKFPNVTHWDNLCAYLFRYASHGAGLTRSRVLEAIRNCEALTSSLKIPDRKIVCLGGGPGNDAIGLFSAVYECQVQNHACLDITVVDLYKEWSICVDLAKIFVKEGNFGNVSDFFHRNNVKMSFLQVELPGEPAINENYFRHLQETDIILMTKLISILDWSIVERLVKSLYENIKKEALILYIDSPIEDWVMKYFDALYVSEEGNNYMSSAINERFNSNDSVSSKARIAVLRKKLFL